MSHIETLLPSLTVSIVLFQSNEQLLGEAIRTLDIAVSTAQKQQKLGLVRLVLIDNYSITHPKLNFEPSSFSGIEWIVGHGNIGYGRGHNLSILQGDSDYHLILNPDVILADDALMVAVDFMQNQPQAGVLAPAVQRPDGSTEYLCKRYPALFDLILRGFAPICLRQLFHRRLQYYEMRDLIADEIVWDVPLVSGCFMFCREPLLRHIGGFNPAYFLYFEDYDLSLRLAREARTVYVPAVRIIHYGGQAARKGWRHIAFFMRSAIRFYSMHGWRYW